MRPLEKIRAWYSHRQGLDGSLEGVAPAEVLARTGWARSIGGANPYLTLFARAGTSREAADASAAGLRLQELPAARGSTYVVPAADFALALRIGQSFGEAEMKVASKLGVTEKEVDKLCDAVVKALGTIAVAPEEIRDSVGAAARSLGEEGKKKGVTTTLPLALGRLQAMGEIRRVPINGRLDQQRYKYALWRPNPLQNFKMTEEQVAVELARRYFSWIGPATLAEFQAFSGLGVKAAKASTEPLKLESVEGRFMLPEDRVKFEAFKLPKEARYALVTWLDGISMMRSDVSGMVDPADGKNPLLAGAGGGSGDLRDHAIVDRGRLVGLWLYDAPQESIAWAAFIKKNKDLERAVARTEEYVRTQLGDARAASLDSPKSRAPRVEVLRKAVW